MHLSSVEMMGCRPNYQHSYPEMNNDDSDMDDLDTSSDFLDTTTDESNDEGYMPIGGLVYGKEE